jgi:hypothetical protein
MSTSNKETFKSPEIVNFYSERLKSFGDTSQGVGWKDDRAQFVRFDQMLKIISNKSDFSINDLGCGSGRFYKYLLSENYEPTSYHGYDILDEMLQSAKKSLMPDPRVTLSKIESAKDMTLSDYTVASGTFNVRGMESEEDWLDHILSTIALMNEKSRIAFAFNLLTGYSDKQFMQPYLYYADPLYLFDYCKRNFSKNVALLHDYFQYDFTIIVRKA